MLAVEAAPTASAIAKYPKAQAQRIEARSVAPLPARADPRLEQAARAALPVWVPEGAAAGVAVVVDGGDNY
jgi:hypothetical protein